MYQQVILIGVDEAPHCRWAWHAPERELCKEAELKIPEFKYGSCSRQDALCHSLPNYPSETVYWFVIVIVFILTPIGASIMAYYGLISRLQSKLSASKKGWPAQYFRQSTSDRKEGKRIRRSFS